MLHIHDIHGVIPMDAADQGCFVPPHPWLANCHVQTLWPTLARRQSVHRCRRERFFMADGDFLDLDWWGPVPGAAPLVLLCHGLTGSSRSPYIRGMQAALDTMGWSSCAINFRGCSGEPNWTAKAYHSGETCDLHEVYLAIRQRFPAIPLMVVGYSLGGSVVLKWLGEQGDRVDMVAAAAVSVPLRLDVCADRLDQGWSRFYRNRLLAELSDYTKVKLAYLQQAGLEDEWKKLEALGDLSGIHSFWEYDSRVVAKLYGFRDAADYYAQCSARQFLSAIRIPTLVIQSRDDPFMSAAVLPEPHELSDSVHLLVTERGGHVGFIESFRRPRAGDWLERRVPAFLHSVMQRRLQAGCCLRECQP